jgi:tryptophan 2,3-dioxygenase
MFGDNSGNIANMDQHQITPPSSDPKGPTYSSYLRLDELLSCQTPLSGTHDEMLFVIIHQASELWMKLCLYELRSARLAIAEDRIGAALKMMARVSRVQAQLIQSWEILATITPTDYSLMREGLGGGSGFQSVQYRLIEFMMGNKNPAMVSAQREPDAQSILHAALVEPSLYDEAIRLLARRGFAVPAASLDRDFSQPYLASPGVEAVWREIYQQAEVHWDLYELAEKLVDLEYRFQLWRFGHLKTVERVIGFKRGTGGSAGVPYLAKVIDQVFFPELLTVRLVL